MEHIDWQVNKSSSECNKYIFDNDVNSDVSFKVGQDQEVIKAHKFILSTRSPVFDRMFNGSFCESESDPVIPDVSAAAFRTLLRYCYYDCFNIEGDVALSVLYAAIKYMLHILERAARKTLIESPDSSDIWDVCKYSTEVGDEELHAGCITYLKGHLSETILLDVIKYAATTGHEELNTYCRKHLQENLSESNILDVIKYVVSIEDEDLHATCKSYLKEHLQGSNIWDVYTYALNKGDTEVHQYCREYFEGDVTTVMEALQSEEFCNIQHEVLLDVLHINDKVDEAVGAGFTPGISISEIELFKACNVWAAAECQRQEIEPTGANKRTVLGECLSLIRFPTMLQKDLLTVVYPTCVLTQAGMVNLGRFIDRDPDSSCQVDFPSRRRQFVVEPLGSGVDPTCILTGAGMVNLGLFIDRDPVSDWKRQLMGRSSGTISHGSRSTMYIESEVRVMLSRLWMGLTGSYKVTVRDERSQKSWAMVLDTKHGNHLCGDTDYILSYIDLEPPQVLEASSRYKVTAECTQRGTYMRKQPGVEYIRIPLKDSPYKEVKVDAGNNIQTLTLSFV